MVKRVPALSRWRPSRTARRPWRAASSSADGRHTVSPLERVERRCSRSLAVMSCPKVETIVFFLP